MTSRTWPLRARYAVSLPCLAALSILIGPEPAGARSDSRSELSGNIQVAAIFQEGAQESSHASLTRLRLQLDLRPQSELTFSSRLNTAYAFTDEWGEAGDLRLDRCFLDWQAVGWPLRLRGGRLPTLAENGPSQLRLGLEAPADAFSPFTDLTLDGISLKASRATGNWLPATTLYLAGQTGAGYDGGDHPLDLEDTEIYGLGLTAYRTRTASFNLLGLAFRNLYSIPKDVTLINPLEVALGDISSSPNNNMLLDRRNLGNLYHLVGQWHDQAGSLRYFLNLAWSRTDARAMDELGTSLLGSWWEEPTNKNGYALYAGLRYDLKKAPLKLGLEYNYGSKNWLGFGLEADNLGSAAKLATRGSVGELYALYTLPALPGVRLYTLRLGCQYFTYEYTGSGFWLGTPVKVTDLQNDPLVPEADQISRHETRAYGALDLSF